MAGHHRTTKKQLKLRIAEDAYSQAERDNTILWSIATLGDMIEESGQHAGFEGIEPKHWSAIGVAIKTMAEDLSRRDWVNLEKQAGAVVALREKNHEQA